MFGPHAMRASAAHGKPMSTSAHHSRTTGHWSAAKSVSVDPSALASLDVQERSHGLMRTRVHCVDQCCSQPLHRNRTCAFGNLLFRPPHHLFVVTDEPYDPSQHATYLHNRYAPGGTIPPHLHSLLQMRSASRASAANVTKVIKSPLYIGADLHGNVGHLMLDSVFPLLPNLLRLRASLQAAGSAEAHELHERVGAPPLLLSHWPAPAGLARRTSSLC